MMVYPKNHNTLFFLGVVIAIVLFACSSFPKSDKKPITDLNKNVAACQEHSRKAEVICRGLSWLLYHPADINEYHGFLEMGGELLIFYHFYVRSNNPRERKYFRHLITSRIHYLLNEHEWGVRYSGETNAYLIFAYVMKKLGIQSSEYQQFIEKEIVNNEKTYHLDVNMNVAISISGLIDGIGYVPKIPFRDILQQGIIAQYSERPDLIPYNKFLANPRYMMEFFYMIAHEIFAMSNFGHRDPTFFLGEESLQWLKGVISMGISRSMEWGEVDILAELIVCAKLLGYIDFEGFEEGVQYILDSQEIDGSFGSSIRAAEIGRSEFNRHVVVMALWALLESD